METTGLILMKTTITDTRQWPILSCADACSRSLCPGFKGAVTLARTPLGRY